MVDIKDICFIRAKLKNDYVVNGRERKGYINLIPYKDHNLVLRLFREVWFRMGLTKEIWFNPAIKAIENKNIVINDPLITSELVSYVVKNHPDKNIFLAYENKASMTIRPDSIKEDSVIKVTYDKDDSNKYNMHYIPGGYQDIYKLRDITRDKYDVVYVGRDKGRGDKVLELEHQFNELGLKTYFHICGDRKWVNKHKRYYKRVLDYTEYLDVISRSKAILNIMPEGQKALTMRDFEVVFNEIKGITNNSWIKQFDLYDPTRFFILGEDKIEDLPFFISTPFKKIADYQLEKYTENYYLKKLLSLADK